MKAIKAQFEQMLMRGIMPLFELELVDDNYLLVNLSMHDRGILFSFDVDDKPVSFDGEIETLHKGVFLLPFDDSYSNLDSYLEMISDNLLEGYILPNCLDRS